jgi:hypothetical protein
MTEPKIKADGTTGFRVFHNANDKVVVLSIRTDRGKERHFALPKDAIPSLCEQLTRSYLALGGANNVH